MTRSPEAAELEQVHDATTGIPCPRCRAPYGARCVNPATGRKARIPCLARIQGLENGTA